MWRGRWQGRFLERGQDVGSVSCCKSWQGRVIKEAGGFKREVVNREGWKCGGVAW